MPHSVSSRHKHPPCPAADGWEMTAAFRAVLPVAHARFHEVADQAGARGNLDVFGLPQAERIHGSGRPGPARIAVAISHRLRRSVHFDFDSSAEAVPLMCRHVRFRLVVHCSVVICNAAAPRHYRLYCAWCRRKVIHGCRARFCTRDSICARISQSPH